MYRSFGLGRETLGDFYHQCTIPTEKKAAELEKVLGAWKLADLAGLATFDEMRAAAEADKTETGEARQ